jgi:hypothetical protein
MPRAAAIVGDDLAASGPSGPSPGAGTGTGPRCLGPGPGDGVNEAVAEDALVEPVFQSKGCCTTSTVMPEPTRLAAAMTTVFQRLLAWTRPSDALQIHCALGATAYTAACKGPMTMSLGPITYIPRSETCWIRMTTGVGADETGGGTPRTWSGADAVFIVSEDDASGASCSCSRFLHDTVLGSIVALGGIDDAISLIGTAAAVET